MALFFEILGFALFVFWLLLIARVVVEFIRSFSRDWHPRGATVVVLELIMTLTDPPVKLLRRIIPQLTIGAVRFDLSIMVLLPRAAGKALQLHRQHGCRIQAARRRQVVAPRARSCFGSAEPGARPAAGRVSTIQGTRYAGYVRSPRICSPFVGHRPRPSAVCRRGQKWA